MASLNFPLHLTARTISTSTTSTSTTTFTSTSNISTTLFNQQNLRVSSSFIFFSCCLLSSDYNAASISIYAERSSMTRKKLQQIFVRKGDEEEDYVRELSVWDSNAEDVRMDRSSRRPRYPSQQRPVKEWDYEAEDGSYMLQPSLSEEEEDGFFDSEEGEGVEDDGDFRPSILNFDVRAVIGFVGLVFPAMLMAVPWLFSNPLGIMMALVLLPAASRFLAVPLFARKSLSKMFQFFNSKPKRKQSSVKSTRSTRSNSSRNSRSNSAREAKSARISPEGDSWFGLQDLGDDLQTSDAYYEAKENQNLSKPDFVLESMQNIGERLVSAGNQAGKRPTRGGWDDLEPIKREILMPTLRTKESLGRRLRKERPLYLRILVALFPFLGYWGGFL